MPPFPPVVPQYTFAQVAAQYANLLQTFLDAADAFNTRNWAALAALFDDNVVAASVHPRVDTETIRGRAQVIAMLTQYVQSRNDVPMFEPVPPICVDIRRGIVSGTAAWTDQQTNGSTSTYVLRYSFIFTYVVLTGKWLCLNKYAEPL
jgi:SnoaL-like domain